jgi:hypothetical protein
MNSYISVAVTARDLDCKSFGLGLDSKTSEYLIWAILSQSGEGLERVEHLVMLDETAPYATPDFRPCAILCNICSVARDKGYIPLLDRGSLQLYVEPVP